MLRLNRASNEFRLLYVPWGITSDNNSYINIEKPTSRIRPRMHSQHFRALFLYSVNRRLLTIQRFAGLHLGAIRTY